MKHVYESFKELAKVMTDGSGVLHQQNCPGFDGCIDWQSGVLDFAEWLDFIGVKVKVDDSMESFYSFISRKNTDA